MRDHFPAGEGVEQGDRRGYDCSGAVREERVEVLRTLVRNCGRDRYDKDGPDSKSERELHSRSDGLADRSGDEEPPAADRPGSVAKGGAREGGYAACVRRAPREAGEREGERQSQNRDERPRKNRARAGLRCGDSGKNEDPRSENRPEVERHGLTEPDGRPYRGHRLGELERVEPRAGDDTHVGPNLSALMRLGSWPSVTSASAIASTNPVGPQM